MKNDSVDDLVNNLTQANGQLSTSKRSNRYSVITPSLNEFTRAVSNGRYVNMSDPNP